jgi:hypothetical protein
MRKPFVGHRRMIGRMSTKMDCWEVMRCGREPGGDRVAELGICPAALDVRCDGVNGGHNAGRLCWAVTGTNCEGEVQGSFAEKRLSCITCEFFERVRREEGSTFRLLPWALFD